MLDPGLPVWVVDAFFAPPLLGNPAAVILLDDDFPETGKLQETAAALAFPTLATVSRTGNDWRIRWFTPRDELNLCGHASLAAAAVISATTAGTPQDLELVTARSGTLRCGSRRTGVFALELPVSTFGAADVPAVAARAIGAPVVRAVASPDDFIYELADSRAVAEAVPDHASLAALSWRGHVITAAGGDDGIDFVSRSFFPALGVDEDQVCVSAHCKLAPYWAARLGKDELVAAQLSPRGGLLRMRLAGERVEVEGQARIRRRATLAEEAAGAAGGLYRD